MIGNQLATVRSDFLGFFKLALPQKICACLDIKEFVINTDLIKSLAKTSCGILRLPMCMADAKGAPRVERTKN